MWQAVGHGLNPHRLQFEFFFRATETRLARPDTQLSHVGDRVNLRYLPNGIETQGITVPDCILASRKSTHYEDLCVLSRCLFRSRMRPQAEVQRELSTHPIHDCPTLTCALDVRWCLSVKWDSSAAVCLCL